ncbi:MAG: hypothetical protein NTY38_04265 [Acidobacteria bacterium]|nr:hypothetical protein [Acidobacteriota bacterium]
MMTKLYWARHIPARWVRVTPLGACSILSVALLGCLAATLVAGATPNPTQISTGLTSLASGIRNLERHDAEHAEQPLKLAHKFLPELKDYTAFYLGSAQYQKGDFGAAAHTLEAVWTSNPPSPLASRALLLAAQARMQAGSAGDALKLVRKHWEILQRPPADLVLAMVAEANGDSRAGAEAYQQIFYQFPASVEAAQAEAALGRLRNSMGSAFPAVDPKTLLTRAWKLMESGNTGRAKRELTSLAAELTGAEQELARVRLGAADYFAKDDSEAYRSLKALRVSDPDADAERLYYLTNSARRLNREPEMLALVKELGEKYPDSVWRREALVSVANYFLVKNQPATYLPFYRAYYEAFPDGSQAAYCHWKVAWNQYLQRRHTRRRRRTIRTFTTAF